MFPGGAHGLWNRYYWIAVASTDPDQDTIDARQKIARFQYVSGDAFKFHNRLPQRSRNCFQRVRFLNEIKSAIGILGKHVAVAAGENDRKSGLALTHRRSEFNAIHAGHDNVGEDQIEGKVVLFQGVERFLRTTRSLDFIAQIR